MIVHTQYLRATPSQFCAGTRNVINFVSRIYLLAEEKPQRDARLLKCPIDPGQVIEYF